MLNKNEMIVILRALDSWEKLNDFFEELSEGFRIINPEYDQIDHLYDIIKNNSQFSSDEDEPIDAFNAIIFNESFSKYFLFSFHLSFIY